MKYSKCLFLLSACILIQVVNSGTKAAILIEGNEFGSSLRSPLLELWPQGPPSETDGLHNTFGFLNEQVVWIKHKDSPGRSALRIPEFVKWAGWERPSHLRGYQVGQKWPRDEESLFFEECSFNYSPSPGVLSARVVLESEEVVRVAITLQNLQEETLEEASSLFCWNHFRHAPLAKEVWARTGEKWTDFTLYVSRGPYRHFYFGRSCLASKANEQLSIL